MTELLWAKALIAILLFVVFPIIMWLAWTLGYMRGEQLATQNLDKDELDEAVWRHPSNYKNRKSHVVEN